MDINISLILIFGILPPPLVLIWAFRPDWHSFVLGKEWYRKEATRKNRFFLGLVSMASFYYAIAVSLPVERDLFQYEMGLGHGADTEVAGHVMSAHSPPGLGGLEVTVTIADGGLKGPFDCFFFSRPPQFDDNIDVFVLPGSRFAIQGQGPG